jgi:3-phenylpropionate/trans-cinnamate dioxygenase ferredoxin reductase subunit
MDENLREKLMGVSVATLATALFKRGRRDIDGEAFLLFHLDADGVLLAASGIGRGNAVARDIKLAEKLILSGARPNPASLASSDVRLKSLLAA